MSQKLNTAINSGKIVHDHSIKNWAIEELNKENAG